ncbi:MAG: nucleotidyltransferase family protein [Hyphomicrobiales bacterium]|nr:nucleotidyltransferase family protein [Hyphomicrobiales bacterium]MCP4997857.1 nucleotidyltransferase family protein [Hyphomicrobiales bacterium]
MSPPNRPLDRQEQQILCRLADPDCAPPDSGEITGIDPDILFDAALHHNIEPVLVRKLSKLDFTGFEAFASRLEKSTKDQMFMSAISLALDDKAAGVRQAMENEKLPHAIVKGAAFATDLYPFPSDRPYSDIDILLPKSSLEPAMAIMSSLGYTQHKRQHFDKSASNEEQKWGLRDNPLLLVELHTNLVHISALRSRISLAYENYAIAGANGARPLAGHFVVAVMHAAAGHKFHQLKLLVDVLQATRALNVDDIEHIAAVLPQLRIHPEISMCLALLDEMFSDATEMECINAIRSGLELPYCWKPVDAHAVMNAPNTHFWRSKIRRHAFRYYQMTLASRPGN